MKKLFVVIATIFLWSVSFAQQTNSGGSGCQWQAMCYSDTHVCLFNSSPGVGCDVVTCENCFRGLVAQPTDPKTFDASKQFSGKFRKYRYRQYTAERLVIDNPGPLADFGVKSGDVVSRLNNKRANRKLFLRAILLKDLPIMVYTPGKAKYARRIKL